MVVTTHEGVPQEFYGAKLIGSRRLLTLISSSCLAHFSLCHPFALHVILDLLFSNLKLSVVFNHEELTFRFLIAFIAYNFQLSFPYLIFCLHM